MVCYKTIQYSPIKGPIISVLILSYSAKDKCLTFEVMCKLKLCVRDIQQFGEFGEFGDLIWLANVLLNIKW